MALMSVAEALARVLADAAPLSGRSRAAAGSARPRAGRRPRRAAHAAAGRHVGDGRLRGARRRCRQRAGRVSRSSARSRPDIRSRARSAPGEAARIFTGGVLPPGADTIVIQENTTRDGDTVLVELRRAAMGKHVRVAGLDFSRGAVLLRQGHRLTDRDLALAAAMNHPARAGPSPAQGRGAGDRRRTGDAGQCAGLRRDRLFERLRHHGAGPRARDAKSSISASRPIASMKPSRRYGARARRQPTFSSPPAAPRSAITTSCRRRSRPKGLSCRSGGWRCGRDGR